MILTVKRREQAAPVVRFCDLPFHDFPCVKANIEGVEIDIIAELVETHGIRKLVLEWSFDKEPRIAVFVDAVRRLRGLFGYVDTNRQKLPAVELYPFYPPNAFIYAMR